MTGRPMKKEKREGSFYSKEGRGGARAPPITAGQASRNTSSASSAGPGFPPGGRHREAPPTHTEGSGQRAPEATDITAPPKAGFLAGNEALVPPPRLLPRENLRAPPFFLSAAAMVGVHLGPSASSRRLGSTSRPLSRCPDISGAPWLRIACGAGWPAWVWGEEPGAACSDRSSDR